MPILGPERNLFCNVARNNDTISIIQRSNILIFCCREAALEIDNDQLRMVFDHAPLGIAVLSLQREVLYCNSSFKEIYGWSGHEMIGVTLPIPEHQRETWHSMVR